MVDEDEARHLGALLLQRLDRLEEALTGRRYLVGDRYTIADLSVAPRVVMYSLVALPVDPDRHANVGAWLGRLAEHPPFARSETVRPAG